MEQITVTTTGWSRESRHKRGYGNQWDKLRARILKRDRNLCVPCLAQGRPTPARQVDHIVNKAQGGTDDPENLQSICIECHKRKTQDESRGPNHRPKGCTPEGIPVDPNHHWKA